MDLTVGQVVCAALLTLIQFWVSQLVEHIGSLKPVNSDQ